MELATNIAEGSGSALPLGKGARDFYEEVIRLRPDLAKKDFSSVYVHLKDL